MNTKEAIENMKLKFTSGNEIQVDRAYILREEYEAILPLLERSDNSDYASSVKDLNKWFNDYCVTEEDNIANEQLKSIIDRLNVSHFA